MVCLFVFFFKQKTAYEMRISDWSSDVCSSDLHSVGVVLLAVRLTPSGATHSHGVTGGVYKARERIHRGIADPRLLAIPTSRSRVADSDPDWDRLSGIGSTSRYCNPLYRPL